MRHMLAQNQDELSHTAPKRREKYYSEKIDLKERCMRPGSFHSPRVVSKDGSEYLECSVCYKRWRI